MLPDEIQFADIFRRLPGVIKPGLVRMHRAMAYLDSRILEVPTILVAGTNGKGSTSSFIWQLLHQAGIKAALYTSPHLVHYRERFYFAADPIADADLLATYDQLRPLLPADVFAELSFFEVSTLLALMLFHSRGSQLNILEIGLGGRWDATNIVSPILSVIVSIGRDHECFLGHSIEEIAREKAGIMRPGTPVFWGAAPLTTRSVENEEDWLADTIIRQCAQTIGAPLYVPAFDRHDVLPEVPDYLARNFSLAKQVADHALRRLTGLERPMRFEQITGAPSPPSLSGRFSIVEPSLLNGEFARAGRPWLLDVCHNEHGARTFAASLKSLISKKYGQSRDLPALVCLLKDKDHARILDVLRSILQPLVLFKINNERSLQPCDLVDRHKDLVFCDSFLEAWKNIESAVTQKPVASKSGSSAKSRELSHVPLVICGSVAGIGEVMAQFELADHNLPVPVFRAHHQDIGAGLH